MGVPESSPSTAGRVSADSSLLVEPWLLSTLIVGTLEWAVLLATEHQAFRGARHMALMLVFELGNFLPYTLLAALFWFASSALRRALASRFEAPERAVISAVFALALPYAASLARFTFSGPQARVLPFRAPAMVALTLLFAATFAIAVWLHFRSSRASRPALLGVGFSLATLALLAANVTYLPNEYERLHSFLGAWAILFSSLAATHFTLASPALKLGSLRKKASLVTAGSLWCISSGFALTRAHDYAWLLWSGTGSSRYVTTPWALLAPERSTKSETGAVTVGPIRPDVETEVTKRARAERHKARAPHIVLFSIDGLRVDHVGAYGYRRHPTTPNIDRFAQRGVRFTRAYSTFPQTQNFNTALLLGRFVPLFGRHNPPPSYQATAVTRLLDTRGYHQLVKSWFEHSTASSFDPRAYAIDTHLPKPKTKLKMEEPMESRLDAITAHLDQAREKDEPVFLWLHLLGTHLERGRFVPHPDYPFGDERLDQYDSAIAGSDLWLLHLERLMEERAPRGRPTIWVLTSDHGIKENSGTRDLSPGVVRVPLIIVAPGVAPRVESAPVDVALDLAATIVDWAGLEPPSDYDGISLIPALSGDETALAAMHQRVIPLVYRKSSTGAFYGRHKYQKRGEAISLFDIEADPEEKQNIASAHPDLVDALVTAAEQEIQRRTDAYRNRPKASKDDKDDDGDDEP